jgi:membrane-bound lytic murein transglycosylase MltF
MIAGIDCVHSGSQREKERRATMARKKLAPLAAVLLLSAVSASAQPSTAPPSPPPAPVEGSAPKLRQLTIANKPWTGDFDKMLERRVIRVDAPYSRSLFFSDKGRERGLAAELIRDFERYINVKYAKELGKRPLTIYIVPATRDRLLPDLAAGLADIAIGNLTVTAERLRLVDFVTLDEGRRGMSEIVVAGAATPSLSTVEDLSGRKVPVRQASSYYESLQALNEWFRGNGKPEMRLVLVPDSLEDEDMMEMLNTGLFEVLVVDDWKARMWAQVLPKVKVRTDLVLRPEAKTGWAIRKDSPRLAAEIDDFFRNWALKQGVVAYRMNQYMKRVKEMKDPTADVDWKRFQQTLKLFEKYGPQYGFDPLMLAAQGYQESQLNQNARSHVGAIGIMQLMPATGEQMKVGDITVTESNIHAGTKYMDTLMTKYFPDASFSEGNRPLFAFAAYNAGPGNVAKVRKEAARRGLDPDKWFNNVEIVVSEKIGTETTTYVRNIYKYYVAYRLTLDAQAAAQKAREQATPPKN